MKKPTFYLGFVLLSSIVIIHVLNSKKEETTFVSTASSKINSNHSLENTQHQLSDLEYTISHVPDSNTYSSPNRQQNLRTTFSAGKISIQNRVATENRHWEFDLVNTGVYVDGLLLEKPTDSFSAKTNANELQYDYTKFSEQFKNDKKGLRQNFIVNTAPQDAQEVRVKLEAKGVNVSLNTLQELLFENELTTFTYNDLKVWDANATPLLAHFEVIDKHTFDIVVNTANAVFPVTIDPIISEGNPTNAHTSIIGNQDESIFGTPVSSAGDVNGDGFSDVIISAPDYDNGQEDEGVVFIYYGSATGISTTADIQLEINQVGARFGFSAATAGDVNGDGFSDVVVGAPNYENGESEEGAVFIYLGSSIGLTTTPSAVLETNNEEAHFGYSVATTGDVNSDGFSDVIVGAPDYSNSQTVEGAFYVYHGSASGLVAAAAAASFKESNSDFANLGYSVASAGDVNGDGYSDIIVGAPAYTNGDFFEGVAFVYYGSGTGINLGTGVLFEKNQSGAQFGKSVASAGDVNGDGYTDVVIGAYNFDNGETNEGAAFIYHGSATGISTTSTTIIETNQADAQVGFSVACAGDVNGDGFSDIIVGADAYDNGSLNEGAAFLYLGGTSGINNIASTTVESDENGASLGKSVACAGDVNGDGFSDIVVGASSYSNKGAAFVFHGSAFSIASTENVALVSVQTNANLGKSVSSAGDLNGDGFSDVIVGVPNYDNGQTDEGAVFVYYGSLTGLSTTPNVVLESNIAGANFGYSIGGSGDVNGDGYYDIVVGAPNYKNTKDYEGAAYLFLGSATGIVTTPSIIAGGQANANLGSSVCLAGDINGDGYSDVLFGAPKFDEETDDDEGIVLVYHGSSTGIIFYDTLKAGVDNAYFGASVATAGDVNGDGYSDIIIGAYGYTNGENLEGAAYVFHGAKTGVNSLPTKILESNQAGANFGWSVASAGNVNGDMYSDIAIGALNYDGGNTNEGAVFVYHGSWSGIKTTSTIRLESDVDYASFGASVSSAGDVNGDGYSDLLVGAYGYSNGETNEGAAYLYLGSSVGLNDLEKLVESDQENAFMGISVAFAGDINGDGYSDVLVGADSYDKTQTNEGKVFAFFGNRKGGLRRELRTYNPSTINPITQSNKEIANFDIQLFAKNALGRTKGKLVWEVIANSQVFSGNPITNSTSFTSESISFTNLSTLATSLSAAVDKPGFENKIRARVQYDAAKAITGQVYGPWIYPASSPKSILGVDTPLPIELLNFTATVMPENVLLRWTTVSESNNALFEIERSKNGVNWNKIAEHIGAGNSSELLNYSLEDQHPFSGVSYYRLKQVDVNGAFTYSAIQAIERKSTEVAQPSIYPNPTTSFVTIEHVDTENEGIQISVYDAEGMPISVPIQPTESSLDKVRLDFSALRAGLYFVKIGVYTQKIYKL